MSFLKMSLAYKPSGPIPGYKPMSFYAGWAYMRGNRVLYTPTLLTRKKQKLIYELLWLEEKRL